MASLVAPVARLAPRSRRRVTGLAALAATVVVVSGCALPAPPGAAPLRYRDAIFTDVTVTNGIRYGSAPARRDAADADARHVPADRRHADPAPGDRARPRRRVRRRGLEERGDGHDGQRLRAARLRRGVDQLPAARHGNCAGIDPPSQTLRHRRPRRPARRPGRRALAARERRDLPRRPDARRRGRRLGRRRRPRWPSAVHSDDPGTSGNPGPSSKVGAADLDLRRAAALGRRAVLRPRRLAGADVQRHGGPGRALRARACRRPPTLRRGNPDGLRAARGRPATSP